MEENKTSVPMNEQSVENDRDARAEELESTFSYDGYQVVRKELFAHLRDPAIVIRKDSITFNTACITGLEDVVYVHVMFNSDLKRIVVRGCDENEKDALRWCIAKEDKHKGLAKRPVKLSMPVNLRKYYKSSTLRNFSSYINVPVYADYGEYSLDDIITLVKHSMGYETAEQLINARFSSNVHAEQSKAIRPVPLVIKSLILRMMYALTGERYFTSVLSNMGRIDLPEGMRGHVKRFDFIIGAGRSNPLSIGCVSVNGQTYLSFSRTIKEPEVERRVLSALIREGVPVVVESNRRMNR